MPSTMPGQTPSLSTYLKSLKQHDIETSIEQLISLLKRRLIRRSRPCAIATAQLLLRVVGAERLKDAGKVEEASDRLIARIRHVGCRLVGAQPRELAVGNVVRRVLGLIREVRAENAEGGQQGSSSNGGDDSYQTSPKVAGEASRPTLPKSVTDFMPLKAAVMPGDLQPRPPMSSSTYSYAVSGGAPLGGLQATSLMSFLDHPALGRSPLATPPTGSQSPALKAKDQQAEQIDIKAEVIEGIKELLDELDVVDSQVAEYALDQIHSNETILTHTSSQTVQKFLVTAARKRKFTVIHAEAYPNDHENTHATIVHGSKKGAGDDDDGGDERWKPLTSMGITVIMIPDTAAFALMPRVNKVLLAPHSVLANGSLIAAAGANTIALAANAHRVPVVVLSGVYKLSPIYPFASTLEELIEYGNPERVVASEEDGEFVENVDVVNPEFDWVEADSVDLYVTNLGPCAPSFLYRIVAEHYSGADVDLSGHDAPK